MPASARQAEKGSAALAVPASLPCSLLLLRLVEPAKELARLPYLFPGRIDWSSPDKSVASSAEFRERAPFLASFRRSARSCKVPCSAYSRGVGDLILRTISSLSLRTPPQPLSHASAASHLPDSTHTRLSHPAVWSWQAKSGSSTSSLAMIPESIVFSSTRRSRWCAWLFVGGSCRRARFVAVWSPGPTGMGPLKLVGVCARGVRH